MGRGRDQGDRGSNRGASGHHRSHPLNCVGSRRGPVGRVISPRMCTQNHALRAPPTFVEPVLDSWARTLVRGVCLDLAVLASLHRGLATTLVSARGLPVGWLMNCDSHSRLGAGGLGTQRHPDLVGYSSKAWPPRWPASVAEMLRSAGAVSAVRRGQGRSGDGRTPSWPSSPTTSMMMRLSTRMPSRKRSMVQASIVAVRPVAGMPMSSPS